jgi:hypothetical protein
MENYTGLEKEWIKTLASGNSENILVAIYEIRNSGSVNILPALFTLINNKSSMAVRSEILQLVGDLKSKEAVPIIVETIEKNDFHEYLPAFIAACWQSGLDFSHHMLAFARLFIHSDYITSLEAFTVLEESLPNANDSERIACIHYIRDSEYLVADEKLPLYHELRRVIEEL